jgi:hypothetical protein
MSADSRTLMRMRRRTDSSAGGCRPHGGHGVSVPDTKVKSCRRPGPGRHGNPTFLRHVQDRRRAVRSQQTPGLRSHFLEAFAGLKSACSPFSRHGNLGDESRSTRSDRPETNAEANPARSINLASQMKPGGPFSLGYPNGVVPELSAGHLDPEDAYPIGRPLRRVDGRISRGLCARRRPHSLLRGADFDRGEGCRLLRERLLNRAVPD